MTDLTHDNDRHANLQRVLDLSIDAIQPSLATQLAQLAIFPGDFDVGAAAAVFRLPRDEAEHVIAQLLRRRCCPGRRTDAAHRRFRLLWPIRELMSGRLDDEERA